LSERMRFTRRCISVRNCSVGLAIQCEATG
jgi:hypothetical protein